MKLQLLKNLKKQNLKKNLIKQINFITQNKLNDINKIKQLRKSTGAGFKDCNSALKESNGDLDKAAEI